MSADCSCGGCCYMQLCHYYQNAQTATNCRNLDIQMLEYLKLVCIFNSNVLNLSHDFHFWLGANGPRIQVSYPLFTAGLEISQPEVQTQNQNTSTNPNLGCPHVKTQQKEFGRALCFHLFLVFSTLMYFSSGFKGVTW